MSSFVLTKLYKIHPLSTYSPILDFFGGLYRKKIYWAYIRRLEHVQEVLCTFNLRPESGIILNFEQILDIALVFPVLSSNKCSRLGYLESCSTNIKAETHTILQQLWFGKISTLAFVSYRKRFPPAVSHFGSFL